MVKISRDETLRQIPVTSDLYQSKPNLYIEKKKINYSLSKKSKVRFIVTNEAGSIVYKSISNEYDPGFYEVEFLPVNLPEGIYFFQFITCESFATRIVNFTK